ncbi:MAG: single-stranded DNA-binding protein [bacterium]|nr:single-stranded DNA-binding protein [bacterium]
MNLNKAQIIGNLVRDPEIKSTATGKSVTSFSIATSFIWTDQSGQKQEKTEFHNIVAWGKLAEICGQYLKKGSKIYLEGRLQTRDWTGQDGIKRYRTEIVAENMIMLDSRMNNGNQAIPNKQPIAPSEPIIDIDEPIENAGVNPTEEEIRVENIPF